MKSIILLFTGLLFTAGAVAQTVQGSGVVLGPAPGITQLTSDVTAGPGAGSVPATVVAIGGHQFSIGGTGGLTFTLTGPTTVTLPTSGTLATLANNLGQFAATTSAQLAGVISDETGSGALVFGTSPAISAPALSGTVTGTYTLGGAPTLAGGTLTGTTTLPGAGSLTGAGALSITGPLTVGTTAGATGTINAQASGTGLAALTAGTAGELAFNVITNTSGSASNGIAANAVGFATGGIFTPPIIFALAGTEKARLAASGALLLNTPTDDGVNTLQVNGGIKATSVNLAANLALTSTLPTITSGFGTTPTAPATTNSIGANSFTLTIGSGGTASTGVLDMPTAAHGWNCHFTDETTQSAAVTLTKQTADTVNSVTVTQFTDVSVAGPWAAADVILGMCFPR